ncbi:MAG: hypothetical protein ACHQ4H_10530, partial [Ktedonobacterales bacterium]
TFMQRAAAGGAVGIIAGSASAREFEAFARTDLTAIFDGVATLPQPLPLTIVLTEGLGAASMRPALYAALAQRVNTPILLDGTTSPRRNIHPELLLPVPPGTAPVAVPMESTLTNGARVGIVAGQRRGELGTITHVFARHQVSAAGTFVPAAVVRLDDGRSAVVPLAALDRVG